MENTIEDLRKSLKEFKVFNLNRLLRMRNEQKEFFKSVAKQKSLEDWLTVKDVMIEFGISRKTFDRWRIDGLKFYQKKPKAIIIVQRKDVINYLKK